MNLQFLGSRGRGDLYITPPGSCSTALRLSLLHFAHSGISEWTCAAFKHQPGDSAADEQKSKRKKKNRQGPWERGGHETRFRWVVEQSWQYHASHCTCFCTATLFLLIFWKCWCIFSEIYPQFSINGTFKGSSWTWEIHGCGKIISATETSRILNVMKEISQRWQRSSWEVVFTFADETWCLVIWEHKMVFKICYILVLVF